MTLNSHPILSSSGECDLLAIKRLWWSILLRDRSLSLGLRRHPQVTSTDFMTDGDWSLNEADFEKEFKHSQVYTEPIKRQLFAALQEQCKLAVLLNDALPILFPSPGPAVRLYAADPTHESIGILETAKERLLVWKNASFLAPDRIPGSKEHEVVKLFRNMTYMYY